MNSPTSSPPDIWRWLIAWMSVLLAVAGIIVNNSVAMAIPMTLVLLGGHYIALDSGSRIHNYGVVLHLLLAVVLLWALGVDM